MLSRVVRAFLWVALFAVFLAACIFGLTYSSTYQHCVSSEQTKQAADKQQDTLHGIAVLLRCEAVPLDQHAGALTAIGTIAIAFFTLTLWGVTGSALRLARDEFISSHRPRIIIHSVEMAYDANDDDRPTIGAEIYCFNVGDTDATIVELVGNIQIRETPLRANIILPTIEILPITIGAGRARHLRIGSILDDKALIVALRPGSNPVLCLAAFIYRDGRGIPRQVGVCRQYSTISGEGRWQKYAAPETKMYEYSY